MAGCTARRLFGVLDGCVEANRAAGWSSCRRAQFILLNYGREFARVPRSGWRC